MKSRAFNKGAAWGISLLALALALGFAPTLDAQLTTTLGSQTSVTNAFPFSYSNTSGRFQSAYAAVDLAMPAGTVITEIRVFGSTIAVVPMYSNLRLRWGYTNLAVNALTASFEGNYNGVLTTALSGDITPTQTAATGGSWFHFPLTSPIVYDGSSTLVLDWSYTGRSGTGFNVSIAAPTAPEQTRSRIYVNGGTAMSSVATASTTGGNYGIQFHHSVQANVVRLANHGPVGVVLEPTGTDVVLWDLSAVGDASPRTIGSMTFSKSGTVSDASLGTVKLIRDNNSNGVVDATDTVLASGSFTSGSITMSAAPLVSIAASSSVRLLFAATFAAPLTLADTVSVSLQSAASVVWSGGTDVTGYPIGSSTWNVEPNQFRLGSAPGPSNTIPFNSTQTRYMTVYSASELAALVPGSTITELRIHAVAAAVPTGTWANMLVRLGPSNKDPNNMDGTFDNNYSGAAVTVLDQPNFQPVRLVGTEQMARMSFVFTTPYMYAGGGLCVEYQLGARTGNGFSVTSVAGRQRLYSTVAGVPASATPTTSGNYGLDLVYTEPTSGVAMVNMLGGPPALATPQVDGIGLRLEARAFGTPSSLTSLSITRVGTTTDAQISNMKLVRDNNSDGMIDAGDTVLGSGVLTAGRVTFSGTPLTAIPIGPPTVLLVAFTVPTALAISTTLGFEVASAADASFSTTPDLSGYPISSGLAEQRMGGNYTINQTSGDFTDIGAAFDALETIGVSGPVILTITDSATYLSNPSYSLGIDATGALVTPVTGSSATNRITLRAAPGQSPKIQGSATGAVLMNSATTTVQTGRGGLVINQSFVTVEGLEVFGGPHFGIMAQGNNISPFFLNTFGIVIRRCKVYDVPEGPGIAHMGLNGGFANEMIIEHNFVWNCMTGTLATAPFLQALTNGAITVRNAAPTTIVRHNTVLHTSTLTGSGGFYGYSSSAPQGPVGEFSNNIIVSTQPGVPAINLNTATYVPTVANFNCYFAGTFCNLATHSTFAAWQAAGKDLNGLDTDPLLVSTTGTIDLHLQLTSPCIDPVGQTSTANIDIDGDLRPQGAGVDIGADEAITGPPPVMDVKYNAAIVAPAGNVNVGNVILNGDSFVFTVENTGAGDLRLFATPPVQITLGTNCDPGTVVQTQPSLTTIPSPGNTTFTVYADPAALGAFDFTVTIPNNDPTKNPYTFTVSGNGVPNNGQAVADLAAGSTFSGSLNGPFTLALNPGDNLVNASIELTDPEADNITVVSITQPSPAATGIVTPPLGAGHPLTLTWTGTADGSNVPGIYSWVVEFVDAVNGTPRMVDVSITINDAPPVHVGVAGQAGSGTLADPYTTDYTEGITGIVSTNLANVSDPNTTQVVTIDSQARTGGNAGIGTGFQFALAGGVLSVAPAGALIAADVGTQEYTITVTDGLNLSDIIVLLTINEIPSFVTAVLSDATQNTAYNQMIATIGGSGTLSVTLTGGTLPVGILLASNGSLSGISTDAAGTFNFILTVTDSLGASSNLAFTLDLVAPAGGIPVITSPAQLPNAPVNGAYTVQLQATGGVGPYTWAVTGGTLPVGLTITTGGEISGTATVLGSTTFTATVTDSVGVMNTASLSIDVVTPPTGGGGGGGGDGGCVAAAGSGLYGLFALAGFGLAALRRRRK